jgi:hypothetical protein
MLFAFVVFSLDRRRILHVNVTRHPTAEWTAQQPTEAFPGEENVAPCLHRDQASTCGDLVRKRIRAPGMEEIVSARRSP